MAQHWILSAKYHYVLNDQTERNQTKHYREIDGAKLFNNTNEKTSANEQFLIIRLFVCVWPRFFATTVSWGTHTDQHTASCSHQRRHAFAEGACLSRVPAIMRSCQYWSCQYGRQFLTQTACEEHSEGIAKHWCINTKWLAERLFEQLLPASKLQNS